MTEEEVANTKTEEAVSSRRIGERVKAMRREAGMTLDGLAERAGVSRAMLSKMERGEKNPTLVIAARVSDGLGVTLTQLIDTERGRKAVLIPRDDRRVSRDPRTGAERQEIFALTGGRGVGIAYNSLPEGAGCGDLSAHQSGVEQYIIVERGRLRVAIGGEEYALETGDALYFEADAPHRFDNAGEGECGYYSVVYSGES
jgi:transcriptional regulator with XRE-family HTH domain